MATHKANHLLTFSHKDVDAVDQQESIDNPEPVAFLLGELPYDLRASMLKPRWVLQRTFIRQPRVGGWYRSNVFADVSLFV